MKQASNSLQEPAQSLSQYQVSPAFFDQATKEKIQRHLTDINDIITEDDIRNIDTSLTIKDHATLSTTSLGATSK